MKEFERKVTNVICPKCKCYLLLSLEHYEVFCDNCDYATNIWCPVESCLGFFQKGEWYKCNGHEDHRLVDRSYFNWLFTKK
jgi:hypothetical protein